MSTNPSVSPVLSEALSRHERDMSVRRAGVSSAREILDAVENLLREAQRCTSFRVRKGIWPFRRTVTASFSLQRLPDGTLVVSIPGSFLRPEASPCCKSDDKSAATDKPSVAFHDGNYGNPASEFMDEPSKIAAAFMDVIVSAGGFASKPEAH